VGDDNQKTTQSSAGDSRDDHPASDGMTTVGLRNLSDQLEVALIEGDAPRRTREGYVAALVLIADFLEDVKFPVTIRDELLQLAAGLQELDRGTVRDFLKVLAAQNHPTDPSDVWQTRALIAIAVDQMMSGGLSKREAGRRITKWFSELKSVSGTKSDNFGSAVCDWHTRLTNGTVKDGAAIGTWNGKERLIARQRENIARAGTSSPEPLQIAYIILRGMLPLDNLKRSRSEREADHSFSMLREPSTEREFTRPPNRR